MSSGISKSKLLKASKWSSITELAAKLTSPIVNMILARLLSPEAFGIVASITIITSFADIFSDAGFQKYLIQHEFDNEEQLNVYTDTAFLSNLAVSSAIFLAIVLFRNPLAHMIGCPNEAIALSIASISVICTSFTSTMAARFKRDLDFKSLFYARIVGALVPVFVTVPIAFITRSYWAIIGGTVAQNFVNVFVMLRFSRWKPKIRGSFYHLKEMLPFSMWNFVESFSIWLAGQANIFIVARTLVTSELGIYKTAMSTSNSILALATAAISPLLFSTLSRYQNDFKTLRKMYLGFINIMSAIVIPLGFGMFLYRDFAVLILLGENWSNAALMFGLWSVISSITITYSNTACELYRSMGKPQVSFYIQSAYLVLYIPTIYFSAQMGFKTLCVVSCLVRIIPVIADFVVQKKMWNIGISDIIGETVPALTSAFIMGMTALLLMPLKNFFVGNIAGIVICAALYIFSLMLFKKERDLIMKIEPVNKAINKISLKIRREKK